MIFLKSNKEKNFLPSFFVKTQNKFCLVLNEYLNSIFSIVVDDVFLYVHEERTVELPIELGTPIKTYKISFEEIVLENYSFFMASSVHLKNNDLTFLIFNETDAFPFVFDYIKNNFEIIYLEYAKFDKKKFLNQLIVNKLI